MIIISVYLVICSVQWSFTQLDGMEINPTVMQLGDLMDGRMIELLDCCFKLFILKLT